jgi:hypothetical protein
MENELRRKLNGLAKWMNNQYEYDYISSNKEYYISIMIFEADDQFFISRELVIENFEYIDRMFRCYYSGFHPCDIRSIKNNNEYDF